MLLNLTWLIGAAIGWTTWFLINILINVILGPWASREVEEQGLDDITITDVAGPVASWWLVLSLLIWL